MTGHADFAAIVGDEFLLFDGIRLRLREVSELFEQGDHLSYSLLFRGSAEQPFGQGTYELTHETLGTQSLFLVPLGPRDGWLEYESVFSFLRAEREEATS